MKNVRARIAIIIAWVIAVAVILLLLYTYTNAVSEKLYDEAKRNFSEVCEQVDQSFLAFMEDTWKNLEDWGPYVRSLDENGAVDYIDHRQGDWEFSRFLFLNRFGDAMTVDGQVIDLSDDLGRDGTKLFRDNGRIMAELGLDGPSPETIFATATEPGTFNGFEYQAIAVTYTNSDLANTIRTEVFSGQCIGFVIYPDGTIALSTQQGGNIYSNYLTYLEAGSDLTDEQLTDLHRAWAAGDKGVSMFALGGTDYYISYQPLGYGSYMLLEVVPTKAVSGGLRNVQEMTVDFIVKVFLILAVVAAVQVFMTQRRHSRRSRAEIEYRDALFELLSANLDDVFVVIDADTLKVSYITPNVKRLLGVTPEDVQNDLQSLRNCLAEDTGVVDQDFLHSIELGERRELLQEWVNREDGSPRWFREAIYRLNIQEEEKFIFILSDRTEDRMMARNLEEALAAAKDANMAKSQFLSNMSHDIRTPMNAIMGFTSLLEVNAEDPVRVREYIRKIQSSSAHLLSLINDVLDMSKIESGKTELAIAEFSLAEMLEEITTIMAPQAEAKDQTFEMRLEGHPAEYLMGDKLRINQILINLLSNAVKYTQVGGKIEFIVKELPTNNPNLEHIRFTVRDNGMGMDEDYLKVIFDPFTRATDSVTNTIQGTGLGMAITKNLVDLMGGIIAVESEPGAGSTFTVDFSFAASDIHDIERYWQEKPGFRVFVVDDEEYICQDVKAALEEEGVYVDFATDGATAVNMVQIVYDEGASYDVILVDWKMPGQNGVDTARKIRDIVGDDAKVLVLTSYDWSAIEHEAQDAGVDGFLPKPFFATSLSQKLTLMTRELAEKAETEVNADALRGLNILAAEDNELSAEMLIERLDMEGASVTRARNGQEAVELFEASAPGEYDLILMDVQMPIMGGHDATRTIRAGSHPDAQTIPIFAMTANVFADDVRDALEAGMNAHIPKPIDMDELRRVTDRELNRKEESDEK